MLLHCKPSKRLKLQHNKLNSMLKEVLEEEVEEELRS